MLFREVFLKRGAPERKCSISELSVNMNVYQSLEDQGSQYHLKLITFGHETIFYCLTTTWKIFLIDSFFIFI